VRGFCFALRINREIRNARRGPFNLAGLPAGFHPPIFKGFVRSMAEPGYAGLDVEELRPDCAPRIAVSENTKAVTEPLVSAQHTLRGTVHENLVWGGHQFTLRRGTTDYR
jgi:hypothetical protein